MRPVVLAVLLGATVAAQDRPLPDYETFVAQVRMRLATDEQRQNGYAFLERRIEQRLDADGRTKEESVKVFEVFPGLPGEDPHRRLIEEDGKPVPADKLAQQDRDRQKDVEAYARRRSTGSTGEKAAREREKERRRFTDTLDDIFRVYDIRMVRRDFLDGHATILFTLLPKAGAKPQTDEGRLMRHLKAQVWISESDHELVRAELEAIDNLSFGLGLVARVQRGMTATFQRRKLNNEIWLPDRATWTASARVLLVRTLRIRGVSEFSKYRKFTVDTATAFTRPPG